MANIGLLTVWFNKKIVEPVLEILRRGAEPKLLAFSAAVGFTIGLFPICGTTVILCGLAIASLGSHCHAPTVMVINLMATPVELSLVVPFLRFGEYISGGPHFPLTSDAMKKVLTLQASNEVLLSIAHALLGWLVAAPLIFAAVYILSLPLFKVLVHKFSTVPLSPKKPLSQSEVRLKVILDVKVGPPSYEKGLARDVLSVVERIQCTNCVVWAKSDSLARDVNRLSSDVMVGYIVMIDPVTGARTNLLRMRDARVVGVYHPLIDEKLVRILHGRNKRVYAWTVEDVDSMENMLSEHVDAIVTSNPTMLQGLMQDIRGQCLEHGFSLSE